MANSQRLLIAAQASGGSSMKVLVTGATGNIGRKVVDHLLAAGADDVRALTNAPRRAALPEQVEVVRANLRRPETLTAAFEGVDRMYLAPAPETLRRVLALALDAGVRHVVDLSGDPGNWWGPVAEEVERSGMAWTHLWPGDFMENIRIWAPQIHDTGAVHEPYPTAVSTPICMDDIAAAASAALLDNDREGRSRHEGRAYPMSGPQVLTRRDMVRQLATALGRDLRFVESSHQHAVELLHQSMGENAGWYVDMLSSAVGARPEPADGVERATGRPATSFADWAVENARDVLEVGRI